jgi:hypothetical protein
VHPRPPENRAVVWRALLARESCLGLRSTVVHVRQSSRSWSEVQTGPQNAVQSRRKPELDQTDRGDRWDSPNVLSQNKTKQAAMTYLDIAHNFEVVEWYSFDFATSVRLHSAAKTLSHLSLPSLALRREPRSPSSSQSSGVSGACSRARFRSLGSCHRLPFGEPRTARLRFLLRLLQHFIDLCELSLVGVLGVVQLVDSNDKLGHRVLSSVRRFPHRLPSAKSRTRRKVRKKIPTGR